MSKLVRIGFRVDAELHEKFYATARHKNQSVAQVLRALVQCYVEKSDQYFPPHKSEEFIKKHK